MTETNTPEVQTQVPDAIDKFDEYMAKAFDAYNSDANIGTLKAIVYGSLGSGKTTMLSTAVKPVLIHSFDPGGIKSIRHLVDGKNIIADTRFEKDDPKAPTQWITYDKTFHWLKSNKVFESIGTYCVDSLTTLAQVAMNQVLKESGRQGGQPYQQDWLPQMSYIENLMRELVTLPCNVILTAHPDYDKDEVTGRMFVGPLITGKLKTRVPLLFDEIYYADAEEVQGGRNYTLLTHKTGLFVARTRLGSTAFKDKEPQDIKALMLKAGLNTDDKKRLVEKGGITAA